MFPREAPVSPPDGDYPFRAVIRGTRFHLGSGTRTGCSGRIRSFAREDGVDISPEDAGRLGVREGSRVHISSPYGTITRRVRIADEAGPGMVCLMRATSANDARNLLALCALESPGAPGYRDVAVKIERAADPRPGTL